MPETITPKDYEYYVTGGTKLGRILKCKVPFHRGQGVFCQSMNEEDWEVVGHRSLTAMEKQTYMDLICDANIAALKTVVERNKENGYMLHERSDGMFVVTKRKLT